MVDTRTGAIVLQRPMPRCNGVVACSPDGSRLASGTDSETHITRIPP